MKCTGHSITGRTSSKPVRIFLVEDNEDQGTLIQKIVQQSLPNVQIVWARSPEQALVQLDAWTYQEWEIPKLILMDLYMPDRIDGLALLEYIKNMPFPLGQVPVVTFSSSDNSADILRTYELGASSYLKKPVDYDQWLLYFQTLGSYWLETVTLPANRYRL